MSDETGAATATINWLLYGTPYKAADWVSAADAIPHGTFLVAAIATLLWAFWPRRPA